MESKDDSIKITNAYIAGISREFALKKLNTRLSELEFSSNEENSEKIESIVQIGIVDAMIRNRQYKELIFTIGTDKLENEDIFR